MRSLPPGDIMDNKLSGGEAPTQQRLLGEISFLFFFFLSLSLEPSSKMIGLTGMTLDSPDHATKTLDYQIWERKKNRIVLYKIVIELHGAV